MEEFNIDLHNPNKQPLPRTNSNAEIFSNLASMEGFGSNLQGIVQLANEGLSDHHHQPHISSAFIDQIQRSFVPNNYISFFDQRDHFYSSSSRGCDMTFEPEILVNNTTSSVFSVDHQAQNSCGGKKRKRVEETEKEKPREVVHVRAKRGQATDSHSLAERLRREKINEKLKCLQDLVPGCYKTMGMAVMLDVIINYVRSLQNQIDFLSMKLSAASLYYDFNSSEAEAMEAIQRSSGYEAQLVGMDKVVGEAYEGISQFQASDGPTSL